MTDTLLAFVYNPYLNIIMGILLMINCLTAYLLFISISRVFKRLTAYTAVLISCEIYMIYVFHNAIQAGMQVNNSMRALLADILMLIVMIVLHIPAVVVFDRKNRNTITNMSIKDCFYAIGAGLCFYLENGMCRCVNSKMDSISQQLTGRHISNGLDFWNAIRNDELAKGAEILQGGENPVIKLPGGKVYSFFNRLSRFGEQRIYELKAVDLTDNYKLTEQLIEENRVLAEKNSELQNYNDIVTAVTVERETLATKISIHDNIGKILLATRHYLNTRGDSFDQEELLRYWSSIARLSVDDRIPSVNDNALEELHKAADSIGVKVIVEGKVPSDTEKARIILIGAMECLLNASRHAMATEMKIKISERNGRTIIEYTNNGKIPDSEVVPGGGLSFVDDNVKAAGGIMKIESSPVFRLIIAL